MKALTIILITAASLVAFAQTERAIDDAKANYLQALKSENEGVVESALFHSMKYKLYYPEQNTSNLEKRIEKLIEDGKSETIRYKAFLVNEFMQNEQLMNNVERADYKEAEGFFRMLGEVLNDHLFAAN